MYVATCQKLKKIQPIAMNVEIANDLPNKED